ELFPLNHRNSNFGENMKTDNTEIPPQPQPDQRHGRQAQETASLKQVLAYVRVSKDVPGSHSPESQLGVINKACDTKYGPGTYELHVLEDSDISGGYGPTPTGVERRTRKTLQLISERVLARRYDAMVVYDLS